MQTPRPPLYIQATLARAGLQLRDAPGKRYGVFAGKAFAAGSLIMTEEAAACCVVRGDKQNGGNIGLLHSSASASAACNHCMCDDKPLMQCTACCVAHYCCKEHQAAHWPRHKAMCARYKRLSQQQQHQQQQHDHSHMFSSIVSLSAALVDLTQAQTTSAPTARPSHDDITFMCSARASPAAAAVMSAMSVLMGDGTHAGTCCMLHVTRHTC